MKLIALTQGQFAQVDDEDFVELNKYKWYSIKSRNTFYAGRGITVSKYKQKRLWMHREILGLRDDKCLVDHKDGNGLNCQKNNLRKCTNNQNCKNRRPSGFSKYLGVAVQKSIVKGIKYKYWAAAIRVNRKGIHIGSFPYSNEGEILAAMAYDKAAIMYHGEFANLNFKEQ